MSTLLPFEDQVLSSDLDGSALQRLGKEPGSANFHSGLPNSELGSHGHLISALKGEHLPSCFPWKHAVYIFRVRKCGWQKQSPFSFTYAWKFVFLFHCSLYKGLDYKQACTASMDFLWVHTLAWREKIGIGVGAYPSYTFPHCLHWFFHVQGIFFFNNQDKV